jgi:cytidine deaminase
VYSGSYIENVAFNPSLPPLQVALVAMARAHKSYAHIEEVTLVELDNAVISQKASMEAILGFIAPHARLRRVGGRLEA